MKFHEFKVKPEQIGAILRGEENFVIRRNDRDFQVGDRIRLLDKERYIVVRIKYTTEHAVREGFIAFSFDWIEGGMLE